MASYTDELKKIKDFQKKNGIVRSCLYNAGYFLGFCKRNNIKADIQSGIIEYMSGGNRCYTEHTWIIIDKKIIETSYDVKNPIRYYTFSEAKKSNELRKLTGSFLYAEPDKHILTKIMQLNTHALQSSENLITFDDYVKQLMVVLEHQKQFMLEKDLIDSFIYQKGLQTLKKEIDL